MKAKSSETPSCNTPEQKELIEKELDKSLDLCNCASACDCTGNVFQSPHTDEEWDSHDKVYHFQPDYTENKTNKAFDRTNTK